MEEENGEAGQPRFIRKTTIKIYSVGLVDDDCSAAEIVVDLSICDGVHWPIGLLAQLGFNT